MILHKTCPNPVRWLMIEYHVDIQIFIDLQGPYRSYSNQRATWPDKHLLNHSMTTVSFLLTACNLSSLQIMEVRIGQDHGDLIASSWLKNKLSNQMKANRSVWFVSQRKKRIKNALKNMYTLWDQQFAPENKPSQKEIDSSSNRFRQGGELLVSGSLSIHQT